MMYNILVKINKILNILTIFATIPSFILKLDRANGILKNLMVNFIRNKFRLPNLRGIEIDSLREEDKVIVKFFKHCTPARLSLLSINCMTNNPVSIKSKFYIEAFSEAAARTIKQIYFNCFSFNDKELQTIVKASRNVERIVFNCCCIYCNSDLDFGEDLSYKTKFFSFQL